MKKYLLSLFFIFFIVACGTNTSLKPAPKNPTTNENNNTNPSTNENNDTNPNTDENNITNLNTNKQIFLIGDSTINILKDFNRTYNGNIYQSHKVGWGHPFGNIFKNPQNYHNVAEGGASSRSYKQFSNLNYWDKTKILMQEANSSQNSTYLLICLGLNDIGADAIDAKDNTTKTTFPGVGNSYYNELKEYIDYAKAHEITPVLITPVQSLKKYSKTEEMEDVFHRSYGDYAETMRKLAEDEHILLLDLAKKSYDVFNSYDPEQLLIDFSGGYDEDEITPSGPHAGEPLADRVHLSLQGATKVAQWVKELACQSNDKLLCAQFIDNNQSTKN